MVRGSRLGLVAVGIAALIVAGSVAPVEALTTKELGCSAAAAKAFAKLQLVMLKTKAKCRVADLSGKVDDPSDCDPLPTKAQNKIDKLKEKFVAKVAKSCSSVCSFTNEKICATDLSCPAKHEALPLHNAIAERCLGKAGAAPFSLKNLEWPGPFCESILGHRMQAPEDVGECLAALADRTTGSLEEAIFGDMNQDTGAGKTAAKCAGGISKAVMVAASKAHVATAACRLNRRDAQLQPFPAPNLLPPSTCALTDATTTAAIDKAITKMRGAIAALCTDDDIADLPDLCASGGSAATTVAEAQDCIEDLVREVATAESSPTRRRWAPITMLNATHPNSAKASCGDGVVTRWREEHTGVGEECDLGADQACPGECLPPGDLFECTCANVLRERFIVDGDAGRTDSDAGWKGASHDATHNDGFGYVSELSNCECSEFTGATCTGISGQPVCDVRANMAPRCSDDLQGTQTCDQRGNNNGIPEDRDCFRCDDNSINFGALCAAPNSGNPNETLCQSQCFDDATGLPDDPATPCQAQVDCGAGRSCLGRCDNSITCNTMTEGTPLPQVSAAISVCIMLEYKTDVTGTKNMVTGESELSYTTRSNIQLGASFTVPCPVCGGSCIGGARDGKSCFGRCDVSNVACLVDADCDAPGDTACLETADECSGGFCSLDLRCSAGPNAGRLCMPDSATPLGVVSHDCPPDAGSNLSGSGVVQINGGPVTTETVEFPPGAPCTDSVWHNYDCPCPANNPPTSGVATRPNLCAAACDGGVNEGRSCALGTGDSGVYTTCVNGTDAGFVCDQDSDCEGGGTCNSVIKECTAGPAHLIGTSCTTNMNCGVGGVCSESCPGARCVPLCYQEGQCTGGARDGDACATVKDCSVCTGGNPHLAGRPCARNENCDTGYQSGDGVCAPEGGVTCDISDPEDGLCAVGPRKFRCTGAGYTSLPCSFENGTCLLGICTKGSPSKIGQSCSFAIDCLENGVPIAKGCESGNDGILGNSDDTPGAGDCEPRPEDCFVNNGFAEGGDTLNGQGSPSDVKLVATFCTPPNGSPAIDGVSGFGGPSRIRRGGSAFVNIPATP
jgi:hypothetical protein